MRKVKLGIIGCGIATRELHWPAIKKLDNYFEIVAVCNRTESKAKQFSKIVGHVPYTSNYKELLLRDDVEAVTVCVPIMSNCRIVEDALKASKHVFAEKPIAASIAQAKKMVEFPARYQRVMMIAENSRYRPLFQKTKQLINNGLIGTAYAAIWNIFVHVTNKNKFARTTWRQVPKHYGGFITDGGVHQIAALRLLLGEITNGCAWKQSVNEFIGKPDTLSFQFETESGVRGILNLFFSANGLAENKLYIMGAKGALVIENGNIIVKRTGRADRHIKICDEGGFREEFKVFHQKIRNSEFTPESFIEAYKDLIAIHGALRSGDRHLRNLAYRY